MLFVKEFMLQLNKALWLRLFKSLYSRLKFASLKFEWKPAFIEMLPKCILWTLKQYSFFSLLHNRGPNISDATPSLLYNHCFSLSWTIIVLFLRFFVMPKVFRLRVYHRCYSCLSCVSLVLLWVVFTQLNELQIELADFVLKLSFVLICCYGYHRWWCYLISQ